MSGGCRTHLQKFQYITHISFSFPVALRLGWSHPLHHNNHILIPIQHHFWDLLWVNQPANQQQLRLDSCFPLFIFICAFLFSLNIIIFEMFFSN